MINPMQCVATHAFPTTNAVLTCMHNKLRESHQVARHKWQNDLRNVPTSHPLIFPMIYILRATSENAKQVDVQPWRNVRRRVYQAGSIEVTTEPIVSLYIISAGSIEISDTVLPTSIFVSLLN